MSPKLARRALGAIIVACLGLTAVSVLARPTSPPAPHYASLLPARVDRGLPQSENIVVDPDPGAGEGTIMIHPQTPRPTPSPRSTQRA